ncbi:RNA polymerase factor sigma-54 [Lewinella cohaerens]|uniref:RNA polymerase factor sigma-54 n=1 Tax=Lewinella cohaerens TaxID=70995 RepID=UPI00037B5FB2|nr:RNA polymerase factor sigma-54 [Lewinella cohaerens]
MLKQTISQKMLQKLSPQQIQLMKLLQVPTINLEQRIKEELEANPALEEGLEREDRLVEEQENRDEATDDNFELDEYLQDYIDDDPSSYKLSSNNYNPDEEDKTIPIAVHQSFHDHLEEQLGLLRLNNEQEETIALQIIGSIDEDGYLRRSPVAILDDLMFSQNIFTDEATVKSMLQKIQRFEPPGIGAQDLQECLLLQLDLKLEDDFDLDDEDLVNLKRAKLIIRKYFDAFTKKHYEKLQKQLDISQDQLRDAIGEILKLNPKPASGYSTANQRSAQYVTPDFFIYTRDGELELELNSRNAPDLRVSDQYRDMLRSYRNNRRKGTSNREQKEAVVFIKQKIDSAKWFIDAIVQRQQTMYNTMYTILQYQYDFFLTGDKKRLRPMILKDIAEITGLDISTISRVANSKFVQTEFGTFRLKEFFSESLSTTDGEDVSTTEVKNVLKDVIDEENKIKPLSDQKLMDILREKGYDIARRTVAKYREQLGVPVARLRKEL